MKKGISLDHAPRSRKLIIIPRIISLLLLICILGCVGYDYLNDERYTMPDVSDGPYILLSDLDIEGKRTTNSVNGEGSIEFPPPYFLQWRVKGCIYCIAFIHVLIG